MSVYKNSVQVIHSVYMYPLKVAEDPLYHNWCLLKLAPVNPLKFTDNMYMCSLTPNWYYQECINIHSPQ